MKLSLRNHILVIVLSLIFSFIFYCDSYADEIIDFTEEVLPDVENDVIQSESETFSDISDQSFNNLFVQNLIVSPPQVEEEEEEDEISILSLAPSRDVNTLPSLPRDDVILYSGVFGSTDYFLLLPLAAADSLILVDGVLVNVGSNTITGRIFSSDQLDLSSSSLDYFVFLSQFSTNLPNTVESYGYPSYFRSYFVGPQGRITYSDTYGDFLVSEKLVTRDHSSQRSIYYFVFFILCFVAFDFVFARLSRR